MRRPLNQAIIGNPDELPRWLRRLEGRGILANDTETTGLNFKRDRVGGLCFAANDTAIYVYGNAMANAAWWFSDQVKNHRELVFHNSKYDMHMLRETFGLNILYPVHDTYIMSFLLDNRGAKAVAESYHGGHGLKNLASAFVDPEASKPEQDLYDAVVAAGGRRGKKTWKGDLLMAPPEIVGKYGLLDAWYTKELFGPFLERIIHWRQPSDEYPPLMELYETERWLTLALRDMEARGVRVNPEFFSKWEKDLSAEIDEIHHRLEKLAGTSINWNSAPQLRELLYDKMGLDVKRWTDGGKKNNPKPSTDEVALLGLNHPIGAELLKLRDASKQHSTYAKGLLEASKAGGDGRIRANFKQTGARTGRLSCEDPNLQQVPRESGARRGFLPDEGLEFRFADYSQVEMRFAAHFSDDPVLVEGFRHDPDFDTHSATAMKMWGMSSIDPEGKKTHKRRRKFAKIMNFAMLFGAGENKVTSQLVSMLSAKEALHSIAELNYRPSAGEPPHRTLAKLLRQRYFEEFANIKNARYRSQDNAEELGYTVNAFGRHRYLDDWEYYKAFNTEIQGSAADQAKRGMANVYRELQAKDGVLALVLQIHDEIVYLSDGDPDVDRRVVELMNETSRFRVPILTDVEGSSTTWQEKREIHL